MQTYDDQILYGTLCALITALAGGWAIYWLCARAQASRPGLRIALPLAVAGGVRVAIAGLFAGVPLLQPLRGPDERLFLSMAERLADGGGGTAVLGDLHVWFFALQFEIFGTGGEFHLRVAHIALAVAGISLAAVAANDVAGPRAGAAVAWILALDPTNAFFATVLHKEAPMLLAEGILLLGAVRMYQRRDVAAALLLAGGVGLAFATRPYAGGALGVAALAVTLHASFRRLGPARRRLPSLAAVCLLLPLLALGAISPAAVFDRLQLAQNANTTDTSNLRLDPIDFSSPAAVVVNVPRRAVSFLLQPYPWQVANPSQRLGVIGTSVAWALLLAFLALAVTRPRRLPGSLPILYVGVMVTLAYALSTGNAGTGFRYRSHVIVAVSALVCTLAFPGAPGREQPVPRGIRRRRSGSPDARAEAGEKVTPRRGMRPQS